MNSPRIRACDVGRYIIRWGEGQGNADVARTLARVAEIGLQAVQDMIGSRKVWSVLGSSGNSAYIKMR